MECGGWTATDKGRVWWLDSHREGLTGACIIKLNKKLGGPPPSFLLGEAFQLLKPANSMGERLQYSGQYVKGEAMCRPEFAAWVLCPGEDSQVLIPPEDLSQVEAWEEEKMKQWEERKKQRTNPVHEVADEVELQKEEDTVVQASCTDLKEKNN